MFEFPYETFGLSQEKKDGEETKKEEPSPQAPKIEKVTAAAVTEEVKPAKEEEKAEEVKVEAVKEKPEEEVEETPKAVA